MEGLTRLLGVREVAEKCKVTENTVSKWIRDGQLLATKDGGKKWRIREDDFKAWEANGRQITDSQRERAKFQREEYGDEKIKKILDSIATYSAHEIGKAVKSYPLRFPLEWGPRIDHILKFFPQYEQHQSNFFRDAISNRMIAMESVMNCSDLEQMDPVWASNDESERRIEKIKSCIRALNNLRKAYIFHKKHSTKEQHRDFVNKQAEFVQSWEAPWKDQGLLVLQGKNLQGEDEGDEDGSFNGYN